MSLRNRLLGLAALLFAVAPIWMPDGPARAGDVTYPMLNNQTTVQDTDLLAVWRASGPLAKTNASVLAAYLQAKFNADYLQIGNNLSDLGNLTTARSNLGLGTAATQNTGTSGANLCLMNQNCTWSGTETFNAAVTFGLTTVHTGLATFNGGIADTGNLSVGGATTLTGAATFNGGLNVASGQTSTFPNLNISGPAGTNRGVSFFTNASLRWLAYETSAAESGANAGSDLSVCRYADSNAGSPIDCPLTLTRSSGLFSLSDGLTVAGAITLPAASIVNADLDTVNGSGGTCTSCNLTINAQGRVTSMASGSVLPSMSGSTSGALLTNNGSTASWASRASLYITNCSNFGCTTSGATSASFSRIGVGRYTVSFSNAFPNTNFTFICLVGQSGVGNWFCQEDTSAGRSTTSVTFFVTNNNSTPQDNAGSINVLVLAN